LLTARLCVIIILSVAKKYLKDTKYPEGIILFDMINSPIDPVRKTGLEIIIIKFIFSKANDLFF